MKFGKKFRLRLLEKGLLKFFSAFNCSDISGIYLRTTKIFGKLPYKFHISHVYPKFELIYCKKVWRAWIKRYCFSPLYLRNEWIWWLVIHVTVIRSLPFDAYGVCTIKYGAICNGRFVQISPALTYIPYHTFFCL